MVQCSLINKLIANRLERKSIMQTSDTLQLNSHEHLIEELSALLLQIHALQTLLRNDTSDIPAMHSGLSGLEQMTREIIAEIRSANDDLPLADLLGVSLVEALSLIVEETAETAGLSSRVVFSGEERALSSYSERLLYRIAQEALYQVQQYPGVRKLRFVFNYGRDEVQMSIEGDGILPNSDGDIAMSQNDGIATPNGNEVPVPHFQTTSSAADTVLSALRHRIEHLDGSLEVSTQPGQGTRVLVRVPYDVTDASSQGAVSVRSLPSGGPIGAELGGEGTPSLRSGQALVVARGEDLSAPPTTSVRVLVVDNQAVTRAGLRRLLESYPDLQVVGEAADGIQAVSETLELGPQVVLMDAQLPHGQSMEALRQIKQLNLDTRVLFLSSQDREESLYETLRAGADGFVLKDIVPDELAQAVRVVASGEVLIQPQLAGRLLSRFGKQARGNPPYEALTAREQEVLQLLARGLRNKEIAARLYVSERTVTFHLANIYQKLNVSGRTQALSKAIEQGLIRT